jgi:epoxyqueuosine reductase QueG
MRARNDDLASLAQELGVDFFGVADLTEARTFVLQQGGQQIAAFPRAVSLGIRLLDPIVDELYRHDEPSAIYTYRGLYNSVNASLDRAALYVAKRLQDAGHQAYPIPASQTISDQKLEGAFSHKLAAHLAGLGWIGKNCLLITPTIGPRVRWATVLTDGPLPTGTPMENRCGTCRECVEICPVSAFTGVPFDPAEPRVVRFRAHKCKAYTDGRLQRMGEGICGLCVHICPHGAKGRVLRRS